MYCCCVVVVLLLCCRWEVCRQAYGRDEEEKTGEGQVATYSARQVKFNPFLFGNGVVSVGQQNEGTSEEGARIWVLAGRTRKRRIQR